MTTTPPPSDPHQPDDGALPSFPTGGADSSASQPTAAVQRPATIQNAVRLMWVGGALSLVSLVIGLVTFSSQKDEIADQMREADSSVAQSTIDAATSVALVFVVVFGAIGAGLWFWMAWKNGQGRSWARIVATVLGGLNIVFTLLGFATGNQETIVALLSIVNVLIAAVILFLLWRKESSAFYTAVTQSRILR